MTNVPPEPVFLVHNFTHLSSTSTDSLLNVGRNLIDNAKSTQSERWVSPLRKRVKICIDAARIKREFSKPPVVLLNVHKTKPSELKEWGSSLDEEDIYSLDDLEEFLSTDLSFMQVPLTIPHHKEGLPKILEELEEPPRKRRKLDTMTLYNTVPQPHFYPSPQPLPRSHPIKTVPNYRKKPTPISPHATLSYIENPIPYSRSSWIIPVRGVPPWDGCTHASVIIASDSQPELGPPGPEGITWTDNVLVSFWTFLLGIRSGAKSSLGPIGLSFHTTPRPPQQSYGRSGSSNFHSEVAGIGNQAAFLATGTSTVPESGPEPAPVRMPLALIDHIKIYHETRFSMAIRNILDAWRFELSEGTTTTGKPNIKKIRILKSARLVLLDERSKGVLIS